MKKFAAFTALLILLISCDDGEVTVDEIDFSTATTQRCANLIYKIAGNEALILELPNQNAFADDPTPPGEPLEFEISATNRVVYRSYNGAVSSVNICGTLPPASPVVVEEWTASSGTVEIVTVAVTTPSTDFEGGEIITDYRHTIVLRNVIFEKPSGSQLFETFNFGILETDATSLPFNFDGSLARCGADGHLFDYVGEEGILLNLDPGLLANEITPSGQPRTALVGSDTNQLVYRLYSQQGGSLTNEHFCGQAPLQPEIVQVWTGIAGVAGTSGIIEVTTTTNGANFLHEVRLVNTYLARGNSVFKIADNYLLGQIITTP